jgi:hypothetical protein
VGRLRDALKHLRREMRGNLESFELENGSRYYYDPMEVFMAAFLHGMNCLGAVEDWPDPPEVYVKMCEARDPAAVLERLTSAEAVMFPYDREALISERRLVPGPHEPAQDLSER